MKTIKSGSKKADQITLNKIESGEKLLFSMYPDHTWPGRATQINEILMTMIDML